MASKIVIAVTVLVAMAALNMGLPVEKTTEEDMDAKINLFKEAIVEQDVTLGMDSLGRIFLGNTGTTGTAGTNNLFGIGGKANLSSILANAPNNTASLTFIPLSTILFPNGLQG
ncbi:unnamed protein product [Allacma fusca]|uniref:Uncharacterized protein n=1 Tax=Allacma fusca TaxID=39272 RepID=A0A8J2PSH3_9HEXA|nr:unnamed protein product [Allacma fusca]